jgi:hypothetical protein
MNRFTTHGCDLRSLLFSPFSSLRRFDKLKARSLPMGSPASVASGPTRHSTWARRFGGMSDL